MESEKVLMKKSGEKENDTSYYRPIYLLNVPGKMMEMLIKLRIETDIGNREK